MTPRQYQRAAMRTIGTFDSLADRMAFCAMEIMSESGEVANLAYKHLWQGHELDTNKLMLEIGDVMWGVAAMAQTIGVELVLPKTADYRTTRHFAGRADRLTRTALRLGKWAGLLSDAVCGYLATGNPNDIAGLDPLVQVIFTQLCSLADWLGMTPSDVMQANIDKLMRRYPTGFSPTASIARVDTVSTPSVAVGTLPAGKMLQLVKAGYKERIETPAGAGYAVAQLEDGSTVYRFDRVAKDDEPSADSGIPADYADSAE